MIVRINCAECDGTGVSFDNNSCKECNGKGRLIVT